MRGYCVWLRRCAFQPCPVSTALNLLSSETDNIINEKSGGYEHVSEYIPISQPNGATLAKIDALQPSEEIGDRTCDHSHMCSVVDILHGIAIDALIVGIETQHLYLASKKDVDAKDYHIDGRREPNRD